ncbi:Formylmethanofuran--tetrahydromethanopterin formyltransferase [Granulibacter bethesdensis CGDNIH1]|uniref:Formylmethanofuran--tetrahydromethanopterin formyltransferase n=2 Tax=Granulibacter bethesdensis TaxID=364410 RepID=Q0BU24_GRABC|nr:Formylmethanofuran--tetrahydromethanopterin formyltransferase [Granulibacter bethesdensis CGDNIH1]APH51484.1 Formylmethanofuran--tetrahydromethanopterin formyltransferase [Granulibacter bethesdensis]APH64177.1 Formylmethanofuran--tetrahydromethanopterin formyltransferase [Granulibacter bethesdensis]
MRPMSKSPGKGSKAPSKAPNAGRTVRPKPVAPIVVEQAAKKKISAASAKPTAIKTPRAARVTKVVVDDTFAEAFDMRATGVIVTGTNRKWARQAAETMTGFATSVIACGIEAGIDRELRPDETPDGRPGVRVLMFGMGWNEMQKQLQNRVGQCVLTCPGAACYDVGIPGPEKMKIGSLLRYFGDGWQIAKKLDGRRFWRIPVMDGEFVCEGTTGYTKNAVGGGNLILLGRSPAATLLAAETAVEAMKVVPDVIMPFPGGIVRSGSKVGSKYKMLPASTNHRFCPTLHGQVETDLDDDTRSVLEIVIDGLTAEAVADAMRAGMEAIMKLGPDKGASRISAGNYGGKLGRHHFKLRELLR